LARDLNESFLVHINEIGLKHMAIAGIGSAAGPLGKLGKLEKAARLLGASAALMAGMGGDHQSGDQHEIAKYTAEVRAQLDEATFDAAYAEGQAMTLEQAMAYALAE
jgi:hypothetical protein